MENISEFELVCDPNGMITCVDNEVFLQNTYNHEIVAANYDEVAQYFGLPKRNIDDAAPTSRTEIYKWSDDQTHFMLNLYKENQAKVGPLKKFRTKKEMWLFLAQVCGEQFHVSFTGEQVEGRFKTVIKKTKKVLKNNRTSGAVRKKIPFESSMDPIIQNDDSILPEVFVGPNKLLRKENIMQTLEYRPSPLCLPSTSGAENSTVESSTSSSPGPDDAMEREQPMNDNFRSKKQNLSEKMFDRLIKGRAERLKIKEANKEKRHVEKLKALSQLTSVLTSLLETNQTPTPPQEN